MTYAGATWGIILLTVLLYHTSVAFFSREYESTGQKIGAFIFQLFNAFSIFVIMTQTIKGVFFS